MGKLRGSDEYGRVIKKQYTDLLEHCREHLKLMKEQLPPPVEELHELLKERGVISWDFPKWTSVTTAALLLPPVFRPLVAQAAELFNRLPVIWLSFAECTGCAESFLRSSYPGVDDILLETISLEYQDNLIAAAGYQAEAILEKAMRDLTGKYICVIEGALHSGLDGQFLRIWARGRTALVVAREVTDGRQRSFVSGAAPRSATSAARPNPTDAAGGDRFSDPYGEYPAVRQMD